MIEIIPNQWLPHIINMENRLRNLHESLSVREYGSYPNGGLKVRPELDNYYDGNHDKEGNSFMVNMGWIYAIRDCELSCQISGGL